MSWFSNLLFGKDSGPSDAQRQLSAAINPAKKQADDLEGQYQSKAAGFDPSASLDKYAQGAFGNFSTMLKKQLSELGGQEVGQGRFDSGFFDEDKGRVVTDLGNNFVNDLNTHALQTAQMEQQGISELGQHSLAKSGEYLDLMAGQADRDTAAQNAKKQQRSAFTSGLMKMGGMFLGGL